MKETDPQRQQLAAALGRVPSGLFILTARNGDVETGLLVSWVQQCAMEPPLLSVAVKRNRPVSAWLVPDAVFALSILDETQTDMVAHFGRGFKLDEPAFKDLDLERGGPEDVPVLSEALACLYCRIVTRHEVGDHDLLVAQVTAGKILGEGQPMVHVRKSGFHY